MESASKLKPYYRKIQKLRNDARTPERLIAHYELERQLADRLRKSSREERAHLYTDLYSELFAKLPDHPQNTRKAEPKGARITNKVRFLRPFLKPDSVFLEIGCGDAALAMAVSANASEVIGLDVTDTLIDLTSAPRNFRFLKTGGVDIDLPEESVDVAYSKPAHGTSSYGRC